MSGLTKSEAAYFAGLVDGRGSVRTLVSKQGKYTYRYPMVRMCVTEGRWGLIQKLKREFGGCISSCDKDGYRQFWQLSGVRAAEFMTKIQPHVKSTKRKQEIKQVLKDRDLCVYRKKQKKEA
jgi:hypothetical protein